MVALRDKKIVCSAIAVISLTSRRLCAGAETVCRSRPSVCMRPEARGPSPSGWTRGIV